MLKLIKYAVASDTVIVTARCKSDKACKGHTFAKDKAGWHEIAKEPVFGRKYWNQLPNSDILHSALESLLTEAEAAYLKDKS